MTGRPRARLDVTEDPGRGLVLGLAGELDLASVPDVSGPLEELLTRRPRPVELDLRDLTFLDSSGVTLLVRIANHFGEVRTTSPTEPVRRVIEVLGLADRFGLEGA